MIPSKFVTDRLPSYAAAKAELPVRIAHERGLRQNNRAESSHVPVRRRERKMQRFRSAGSAQRFLSAHASVYNTFNFFRHLITSATKRRFRTEAFETWRAAAGVAGLSDIHRQTGSTEPNNVTNPRTARMTHHPPTPNLMPPVTRPS